MPLNEHGGLLQIPEGCSGRYGDVVLPATFGVQTKFRVPVPVHRKCVRYAKWDGVMVVARVCWKRTSNADMAKV